MTAEERRLTAVIVALVLSVLALAVRLPDGRRLDARDAYALAVTGGLLTLLTLAVVDA